MKKNRLRGGLERNGRTIITGEISVLISLITFIVAGTPIAVIVGLAGIILTAIVGIVVTEHENRARERERREQEAHIAPVRASALKQVSSAAFELVRYAMPYRDVAGGGRARRRRDRSYGATYTPSTSCSRKPWMT